ncbi:cyclic lactone autoinducer peptide [Paenibacillus sp. 7124]|nr:cyclic lactone autoinducer peptide [Paenibacillus apii]NJJ38008.1 cyclic lactone autoinducer peptide [Paenibacillus apii]
MKHSAMLHVAALLSFVAVTTVDSASAWYIYSGDVPEELLK